MWISQDVRSAEQRLYFWFSAAYMQETGNYFGIVRDSPTTWSDLLLQPHKHWTHPPIPPASQPYKVSDNSHLKDQHQHSPWSNTWGFDSRNAVTFSSFNSPSIPPFLPPQIHSSRRHAGCFNLCLVTLHQPSWGEEEENNEKKVKWRAVQQQ